MDKFENLTDEQIVEKIRSENQELYALIIDRYQNKLLRYSKNLIKDEDRAVDIAQDTFINAFTNLNSFDAKRKFSSWIYRIAHNITVNMIKKYKREVSLPEDFDVESEENVQVEIERREMEFEVEKCLGTMPIIYAEPLSLYYVEQKSYDEISDILRIPMGTVATRINRAKKIMRNICRKI